MSVRPMSSLWLVLFLLSATVGGAQQERSREDRPLPEALRQLKLGAPLRATGVSPDTLRSGAAGITGRAQVIVRLTTPSMSEARSGRARTATGQLARIHDEQNAFVDRCLTAIPNTREIARVQLVLNAVFLEIDAGALADIAADPAVVRVVPVANYEKDLAETVSHIGAQAVQDLGFDGTGVRVAILDSGIDYTHANLGGPGTTEAYVAAHGGAIGDPRQTSRDGLFPTAKVVEGFDFVGELWPTFSLSLLPDEDPIDFDGHGTHVADISGGLGGVAPGVDLYAVKVCSAVATTCSGIALIQGMEFAVDPDGDGDPSDHVDIVNMSLGSPYGQPFDDDLSAAVDAATALGVLTVASAGNSADKPYVSGTPGAASTALSVAQTHVPSAFLPFMEVIEPVLSAGLYESAFQPWSAPLSVVIEGPAKYGDGAGGNVNGCAPFDDGSLAGEIVFVDRGACNFSDKIRHIELAGGVLGIIGLVTPGDPFPGGFGGGPPIEIPGYMISQADGNILRTGDATVRFDPDIGISLTGSMVTSSSRGPQTFDNRIKPEIGAPGASVSAQVGTGTGQTAFGGTSGAAPMVTGSAALLMDAFPERTPNEIKAALMNTGETDILNVAPTGLAPITRIGGGEVRVDRALSSPSAAWDWHEPAGALSFGFVDVSKKKQWMVKWLRLRNYTHEPIVYDVEPEFRFADDESNGAVQVKTFPRVWVRPGRDRVVPVLLKIRGDRLRDNLMNSGDRGADADALSVNEYDGYLRLDDGGDNPIQIPWHVLPRKAAKVQARPRRLKFRFGLSTHRLENRGVGTAQNDAYALLGTSDSMPQGARGNQAPMPDIRAVGVNTFTVPAGFCSADPSFVWVFAINTWERQSHLFPVIHNVYLDTDRDGDDDYVVLNADLDLTNFSDGRQVTWVFDAFGSASAFFFTEHATNTANTVLTICGEQIGLGGSDLLTTRVDVGFEAQDFYFGGPGDFVPPNPLERLTITPLGERYFGIPEDVPGNSTGVLEVVDFGAWPGNTDELGLMLVTNGARAANQGGATQETETLLLFPK